MDFLWTTLALIQALLVFFLGYAWVAFVERSTSEDAKVTPAARICAAFGLSGWIAGALFYLLSIPGLFDRWVVTGLLFALGSSLTAAERRSPRAWLRGSIASDWDVIAREKETLKQFMKSRRAWGLFLGIACTLLAFLPRWYRAFLAPPAGWDALTYHLFRAGQWVQAGGYFIERAPDAAGYYAYYPPLGDAYWSWVMLATHDTSLLPLGALIFLAGIFASMWSTVRSVGASRYLATWSALALIATPAVVAWSMATYVDNTLLAMSLAFFAWLPHLVRAPSVGRLGIAAAILSTIVGIKTTGVVVGAVGSVLLAWLTLTKVQRSQRMRALAWMAVLMSVGLVGYAVAWIDFGNPLYPFPLRIAGFELGAGNEENVLLHRGAWFSPELLHFDRWKFAHALFGGRSELWAQHLNFGPMGLVLLPAALFGSAGLARDRVTRIFAIVVGAVLLMFALKLYSNETLVMRTMSAAGIGRFLNLPFALLLVVACAAHRPRLRTFAAGLCVAMVVIGSLLAFPRGWTLVDSQSLGIAWPWLLLLTVGVFALPTATIYLHAFHRSRFQNGSRAALALAIGTIALASTQLGPIRNEVRADYDVAIIRAKSYDPHPLDAAAWDGYVAWRWLDKNGPLKVAFAAGWNGKGHHWYRSPLLGSHLQNEVVYVAPSRNGDMIDYRLQQRVQEEADFDAWLARLVALEVDIVVLGSPASVEHAWVEKHPELFELVAHGPMRSVVAFELHRDRVKRHELP
jgi:hypothetical protein